MGDIKARVLTGNEACVEGAIAAGMRFFAGYPITPASEISEISSEILPKIGGKFIQMEDEIGSIAAIIGASLAGAKAMTASSGPGISLMQENLGFAVIAEIPCVIVNVMRLGPSSGVPTVPSQGDVMQACWGTHGDHPIIVMAVSTVREAYDITVRAFNLAEKYRTPVIVLYDAMIAHMSEKVVLPDNNDIEIINRKKPTVSKDEYFPYEHDESGVCPMAEYGDGYIWFTTGIFHDKTGFPSISDPKKIAYQIDSIFDKINNNLGDIIQIEEYRTEDAEVVVVAYGSVARSAYAAVEAARNEGIKAGLIKLITLWPFPEKNIGLFKNGVKRFIVCEMNHGQIYSKIKETIEGTAKVSFLGQYDGKLITPEKILSEIRGETE